MSLDVKIVSRLFPVPSGHFSGVGIYLHIKYIKGSDGEHQAVNHFV